MLEISEVFILSMPLVGVNYDPRRSTKLTDHWWFQRPGSVSTTFKWREGAGGEGRRDAALLLRTRGAHGELCHAAGHPGGLPGGALGWRLDCVHGGRHGPAREDRRAGGRRHALQHAFLSLPAAHGGYRRLRAALQPAAAPLPPGCAAYRLWL